MYFANSGGRIVGLDITDVENGNAPIVFDYWVGDDVDSAIVIDDEGMLYVSAQYERYLDPGDGVGPTHQTRSLQAGRSLCLGDVLADHPHPPRAACGPPRWSATSVIYTVTNKGYLVVVDRETGEELWFDDDRGRVPTTDPATCRPRSWSTTT